MRWNDMNMFADKIQLLKFYVLLGTYFSFEIYGTAPTYILVGAYFSGEEKLSIFVISLINCWTFIFLCKISHLLCKKIFLALFEHWS